MINLKDSPTDSTHIGRVVDAIRASDKGTVLVVGHTITIPDIVARLGGPKIGEISDAEYSNLFVLVGDSEKRLVRSRYGAADHIYSSAVTRCVLQWVEFGWLESDGVRMTTSPTKSR